MSETVRWLLVLEVIGAAYLPLTLWLFRALPDRGYALGKVLGLVLMTYLTWIAGSFAPIAGPVYLPLLALLVPGLLGWWLARGWILDALSDLRQLIAIEEGLFLAAFIVLTLMRAYVVHPGIAHTEQYMDLSFLNASLRSTSYPPYDPWMSGHSINYYYLGYLMYALVTKLSGLLPWYGFNLAVSSLFAFTVAGCYSIGLALTRRRAWALLFPLFIALLGNWHAATVQLAAHDLPTRFYWFWDSSRVISGPNDYTINEFPYFSFLLADLHPHVMALPVTLLGIGLALALVLGRDQLRVARDAGQILTVLVAAVVIGSLFTINSWDYPTYLLLACAVVLAGAYIVAETAQWWKAPLATCLALAIASLVLFLPFYAHFTSLAHGIGVVQATSNIFQFLQIYGLFLLCAVALLTALALLLQPVDEDEVIAEQSDTLTPPAQSASAEAGQASAGMSADLVVGGVIVVAALAGVWFHQQVLMLLAAVAVGALFVARRVLFTEEPNRGDLFALGMIALGCGVLAFPEVFYLRDVFDGSSMSRMNTVFKFYYQGWTLLGLAAAYAAYRASGVLGTLFNRSVRIGILALITIGTLMGLYYTAAAPQSFAEGVNDVSLNGLAQLRQDHPGDYAAILWLRSHAHGNPVELEMTGKSYDETSARIATFTGLPTVMGWSEHEGQWRGADPEIQSRVNDVNTIYTSTNDSEAKRLLRAYHVRYVIVGPSERAVAHATPQSLGKFASFMHVAFRWTGSALESTTVYSW